MGVVGIEAGGLTNNMIPRKQHTIDNLDETVQKFRQGSAEAFSMLYKAYQQRVYRYCVKMMGSEAQAKDAVKTFLPGCSQLLAIHA